MIKKQDKITEKLQALRLRKTASDKQCCYCSERIPKSAKKCKYCRSFQTWRRHVGFGATILSLMLGMIATYGFAQEPIKALFTPEYRIEATRVPSQPDIYRAYVRNTGKNPFALRNALAVYGEETYTLKWDEDIETILPNEAKIINFEVANPPDNSHANNIVEKFMAESYPSEQIRGHAWCGVIILSASGVRLFIYDNENAGIDIKTRSVAIIPEYDTKGTDRGECYVSFKQFLKHPDADLK